MVVYNPSTLRISNITPATIPAKNIFFTRGVEFGLIYALVAIFPMMWLIYSAMSISLAMVSTWFVFGLLQGVIAGLIFEKINP